MATTLQPSTIPRPKDIVDTAPFHPPLSSPSSPSPSPVFSRQPLPMDLHSQRPLEDSMESAEATGALSTRPQQRSFVGGSTHAPSSSSLSTQQSCSFEDEPSPSSSASSPPPPPMPPIPIAFSSFTAAPIIAIRPHQEQASSYSSSFPSSGQQGGKVRDGQHTSVQVKEKDPAVAVVDGMQETEETEETEEQEEARIASLHRALGLRPPPPPTSSSRASRSTTSLPPSNSPISQESTILPLLENFFSLPSSSAERGISFEEMLSANKSVADAAAQATSGNTYNPPPSSLAMLTARSTTNYNLNTTNLNDNDNNNNNNSNNNHNNNPATNDHPLSSSSPSEASIGKQTARAAGPSSTPAPIHTTPPSTSITASTSPGGAGSPRKRITSRDFIGGVVTPEEWEDANLDYQLKGRNRMSRGYSADISTNNWTTAQAQQQQQPQQQQVPYGSHSPSITSPRRDMFGTFTARGSSSGGPGLGVGNMIGAELSTSFPASTSSPSPSSPSSPSSQYAIRHSNQLVPRASGSRQRDSTYPQQYSAVVDSVVGKIPINAANGEFSGYRVYQEADETEAQQGSSSGENVNGTTALATAASAGSGGNAPSSETPVSPSQQERGAAGKNHRLRNHEVFPGRNMFLCGGRIVTSRDFPAFSVAIVIVLLPSSLFWGFVSPYLWHHLSPAVPIVQGYMFVIAFSSMLKTSWTDPGILPRGIDGEPPLDEPYRLDEGLSASFYPIQPLPRQKEVQIGIYTVRLKYCDTCKIYRPPRCSHCRQCDNCVEDEDHHCIWLNNCIGRRNYRYFLIFVTTASLYALLTAGLSLTHLLMLYHEKDGKAGQSFLTDAIARSPASLVLVIFGFVMGLSVGALACYHYWLATKNRTTHEQLGAQIMRPMVVDNPFDRGSARRNCWAVLCRPPTKSYIRRRDYVVQ